MTSSKYFGTAIHCIITLLLSFVDLGWLSVSFYLGREIAQAEYRYIQDNGNKRNNCPWYCGFLSKSWNTKSILDWLLPLVIALVFN